MLGYAAAEVVNRITPADLSDPQDVLARAETLSVELGTPITPGFEALVFKASRGIEDIYELTYVRRDGTRLPAMVSVTALRDAQDAIIGYLLIGTDNTARKQGDEERARLDQRLRDQHVNFLATAKYLVRHADGSYDVYSMEDPTLPKAPPRVSVRTMAISPFPEDQGAVVYAGGFDCNNTPVHDTAWALRGSPATALGH
jgi:hypothetical protein